MTVRPRLAAVALAAACSMVIAACAAPWNQAVPPSTASSISSSPSVSSGPPVTVPGLSTAAPSSPAGSPTSEPPPPPPTPEPTPEPEPAPVEPEPEPEPAPEPEPEPEPAPVPAPVPAPAPQPAPAPVSGSGVVVIDPGHNGANAANPGIINKLVDAGFGDTKACNTTGTSTNDGYPEHAFAWGVATRLKALLEQQGVTVIMTRSSNDGVGPCVNERAAIGNNANADLVLSIHGDGVNNDGDTGFYVMTAERKPAGAQIAARSDQLAVAIRDGLADAGLSPSNYLGSNGLWERGDLAGLNLSTRPTVMVESGNMRAPADAALMSSAAGQEQFAQGYANGVLAYLGRGAG